MESIIVIEKPENVSWDMIHDILYRAHEKNRLNGIFMRTATLSGEELEARLGPNGRCYIAMYGTKIIGTGSVKLIQRNCWYANERVADLMLIGVLPEYVGKHIYSLLYSVLEDYSKSQGVKMLEMDTAEKNKRMLRIANKKGFKKVGMFSSPYVKHYSIILSKWLYGCPYSNFYIMMRFLYEKYKMKLRYKPGHIRRFF